MAISDAGMEIRPLSGGVEYAACVALQREIWGDTFAEVVPATVLMIAQRMGGIATGAFDPSGELLGFVFGISGVEGGTPAHWSDMLAVRPAARRQGIGRRLKWHQREQLLALGIDRMFWTYDPLVAANAHLNVERLGARPTRYVEHMYGDTGSRLHQGLATDRLIMEWKLRAPHVEALAAGELPGTPVDRDPGPSLTQVELPADIERLRQSAPDEAVRWQQQLRRTLGAPLNEGTVELVSVRRTSDGRWFYLLRSRGTR